MNTERVVPLSIIVGTTQPWPEMAVCLDSIHDHAQELDAEILVVDGHGSGLPADIATRYPQVTPIRIPGASIFQMRAHAMLRARGELIAVTEDHCRVASDWCRQIIAAHRDWPDAAVIGGVVENGSPDRLLDWVHFVAVNGRSMPPVPNGEHREVTFQASVSYKRAVLPREFPPWGYMEWMLNQRLRAQGHKLVLDDRIVVHHIQSFSLVEACAIHFHDSRTIAGFRKREIGLAERVLRVAVGLTVMGPLLLVRSIAPLIEKRRKRELIILGFPYFAVLATCRTAGAVVGFIAGEGDSPKHIR
jgi:hypothetical protein